MVQRRPVAIVLTLYVRRANPPIVRRVASFNPFVAINRHELVRMAINREKSQLFHAESCSVGMTTFGVFGFMLRSAYRKPSSEHSKVCIELLDTF